MISATLELGRRLDYRPDRFLILPSFYYAVDKTSIYGQIVWGFWYISLLTKAEKHPPKSPTTAPASSKAATSGPSGSSGRWVP